MTGVASTALLVSCGYGFVEPIDDTDDPFEILLEEEQAKILTYVQSLPVNAERQQAFLADPIGSLVAAGIIDEAYLSGISVSEATQLLYYIQGSGLAEKLAEISTKYPSINDIENIYTGDNVNIEALASVEKKVAKGAGDWEKVVEEQIEVIVSDEKVRDILNLNIAEADIPEFSLRLAAAIRGALDLPKGAKSLPVVANVNVAVNVNWKANANIHTNANANVNANANANVNVNSKGVGSLEATEATTEAWIQFADLFTEAAKANRSA